MYSHGHLCDALNTVAPESQWNLQKSLPTLKQETVEYIDEQECSYNGSKCHEPLDSSEYVNQYDSKDWVLKQMKEESSELESPQSGGDKKSEIVFQEKESLKLINKQETDSMKREEESFNVKVENKDEEYPFAKEMERLEEQRILDNVDETSIHYDILLSPQEVKCKLCGRIFKNNYNLLKHNNEHIKVEINPPEDKVMSELLLTLHIKKMHYDYGRSFDCWCGEQFRTPIHLSNHKYTKHGDEIETDGKYQCDMCKKVFKCKRYLIYHVKRLHFDYGRKFDCWCGEKFRSPIHLNYHRCTKHSGRVVPDGKYQCDICKKVFKCKQYLIIHIKRLHFDYGRKFNCWCGKQFRSAIHLGYHRCTMHGGGVKSDGKYQCDICKKVFKCKQYLIIHIKRLHFDYGRKFNCWCGKQFRTPLHLKVHERELHDCKTSNENDKKYKCERCESVFKLKRYLSYHIKRIHR